MFSDQVEIRTSGIQIYHRHLEAPLLDSLALSLGMNSFTTFFRMFPPYLSNASMNLRINSAGSLSQMCMGSRSRVSPMLTKMGECAFSNVSMAIGCCP